MSVFRKECWCNVLGSSLLEDEEMLAIDEMENALLPLDSATLYIRRLISMLECCHFKAEVRIEHIVNAIGSGDTCKGPGKRAHDGLTDAEREWHDIAAVLQAWLDDEICNLKAAGFLDTSLVAKLVGEKTTAKAWIVARLRERIAQYFDPAVRYYNLSENASQYYSSGYGIDRRPYADEQQYVKLCNDITLREPHEVQAPPISLASAIDSLEPCNWNFRNNIAIILRSIGGDVRTGMPFASCARNIMSNPLREKFLQICSELRTYNRDMTGIFVEQLGEPNAIKTWLVVSLEKTIRAQMGF